MLHRAVPDDRRSLRRLVLVPLAVASMLVAAPAAAIIATPGLSSAATPTLSMAAGGLAVKTTNGVTWQFTVSWNDTITPTAPIVGLGINRTVSTGGTGSEEHFWEFNVSTPTGSFNASTGVGTFNIGTQGTPVADIDLAFKSTKSTKSTCTSGSETTYSGTLKGKAELITSLAGGGTVGGAAVSFPDAEVKVDNNCITPFPSSCVASTIWAEGSGTGTGSTPPEADGGNLLSKTTFAAVLRKAVSATPKNDVRQDIVQVNAGAVGWNATSHVVTVTSSASGIVTGSATLTGGKVTTHTTTCTVSGKKYTETTAQNSTATYTASKTFTGHPSLSGTMTTAATTKNGFYIITTLKAAA